MNANTIIAKRFAIGTPRSQEYRDGAYYTLSRRMGSIDKQSCPHPIGTAQADAWFAGCEEGLRLWHSAMEVEGGAE